MTCDLVKKNKKKTKQENLYFNLLQSVKSREHFFFHEGHFFVWFTGFLIIL